MSQTLEAAWRHRTRTPVLVATACAWLAVVEASAVERPRMDHMAGAMTAPSEPAFTLLGLMVAAMMTPLLIEPLRHGLARSLRRRRPRAVGLLVLAHLAVWLVGGLMLEALASLLLGGLGPSQALAAGLAVALLWQVAPVAQRLANRHHAHPPLAAFGAAADADLVAYGVRHAASCLGVCWPVMLLPALAGTEQLSVMAVGSLWMWAMSLEVPAPPRWRVRWPSRMTRLALGTLGRIIPLNSSASPLRFPG